MKVKVEIDTENTVKKAADIIDKCSKSISNTGYEFKKFLTPKPINNKTEARTRFTAGFVIVALIILALYLNVIM